MTGNFLAATSAAPKVLYSGQLADTADHLLYSPASGVAAFVKHAVICNTSGSAVTITAVRVIQAGGSVDGTHCVIAGFSLPANDSMVVDELIDCCLGPGDSIHMQVGTGAAVDVILSGIESF